MSFEIIFKINYISKKKTNCQIYRMIWVILSKIKFMTTIYNTSSSNKYELLICIPIKFNINNNNNN